MKQFFKVFRFEYGNYAKDKVFIGLTVFLLLGITLTLFFPRIKGDKDLHIGGKKETPTLCVIDNTDKKDMTEFFSASLKDHKVISSEGSLDDAKKIATEKENASVIIVNSPLSYKYIVKNMGLYDTTSAIINELMLSKYKNEYLQSIGLTMEQMTDINTATVNSESIIVGKDQSESFFFTYILMLILYLAVLMYGQLVAQSVVTEKSSRAMELLITSAKPESLIFGKVLGAGFAGLTQLGLILIWSFLCFKMNKSYWVGNMVIKSIFDISPSLIAYTILFFVLGFLLYAFIFGAMSSLASKMEEIGSLTMPAIFLMVISFMATIFALSADKADGMLMKVLSFVPFSSPMAMFARITMNTASSVEIIISIAILILTNILIGYLAVAIYRIGILMYGKPPKLNELIRAIKINKK